MVLRRYLLQNVLTHLLDTVSIAVPELLLCDELPLYVAVILSVPVLDGAVQVRLHWLCVELIGVSEHDVLLKLPPATLVG